MFDASARSCRSPSLNGCLYSGPKLQQNIVDILIGFHVHKHVFTSDICKMYRQVLVLPQYRKYQHVLWRASPHDELGEYELHIVTYSLNCAPFLVLQEIVSDDCDNSDSVCNALTHHTYVDDICDRANSVEKVLRLQSN